MACCKGAEYGNWCAGEEIVWKDEDGNEYCLFHAPEDHKGVDEKKFTELVEKNVEYQLSTNNNALNFDGAIFIATINFNRRKYASISLNSTTFLEGFGFENAKIDFPMNLSNMSCYETLYFSHCEVYNLPISYSLLIECFHSYKSKWHCEIELPYDTRSIELKRSSFFTPQNFYVKEDTVEFQVREISLHADFTVSNGNLSSPSNLRCYSAFSVKEVASDATVTFNGITFNTHLKFQESSCEFTLHFINCTFSQLWINSNLGLAKIYFIGCDFTSITLDRALKYIPTFKACNFPIRHGRNHLSITNDLYNKEELSPITILTDQEHIYRQLKKQAQDEEFRMLASDWHYWEKHYCEKRLRMETRHIDALILKLYRIASEYGESVSRAALLLAIFLLSSIVLGTFKYTGIFTTTLDNFEIKTLTQPNGLGIWSEGIYYYMKPIWSNFSCYSALQTVFDFIPLATKAPETTQVSLWRPIELIWQVLITFQATLLGFALRNRYRR